MATIKASPFKLALVQLGQVGKDKTRNLAHAREMVLEAAKGAEGKGKVDVVVLPVSCEPMCHELGREEGGLFGGRPGLSVSDCQPEPIRLGTFTRELGHTPRSLCCSLREGKRWPPARSAA
jgi:hypothetical protein